MVHAAAHDHDAVEVDLLRVRGVRRVEDEHLHLRLEVVERREQHRLALLRADPLGLGDHPADRHPLAVALAHQVCERAIDARAERRAHLLQRVRRQEEPERLLLHRVQVLALVREVGHRRVLAHRPAGSGAETRAAGSCRLLEVEDRGLAELGVLLRLRSRGLCMRQHGQHAAARGPGRVERAAADQRLDRLLVHAAAVDALAEVPDRRELAALLPGLDHGVHRRSADVLHRVEHEADVAAGDDEVVSGLVHVGRQHLDPHLLAARDEERHLVLGRHHRGDEGGHVLGRVVGLEPRGAVGDERVARGVAAIEGVVRCSFVDRPEVVDHSISGAGGAGAREELLLHPGHTGPVLLADRLPQVVRLGPGEAGDLLGDLHRLLLVEGHPVRGLGDRAEPVVEVGDPFGVPLVARVLVHEAHRARAVKRPERHQVVELGRPHFPERLPHPIGLELEHADRVAALEHLVRPLVVERKRGHVGPRADGALDDVEGGLDHVQVAQAEEVHLQ